MQAYYVQAYWRDCPFRRQPRPERTNSLSSSRRGHDSNVDMPQEIEEHGAEIQYGQLTVDLRRYVRSQLRGIRQGHDIDVEDVVQETFLRVWSSGNREDIQNGKGYLFRTAKNLIIDISRRRAVQPFETAGSLADDNVSRAQAVVNLTPERYVSAREDLGIALQALEALPENCRKAFYLQRSTGHTYAKVASMLQMSESMVQKHMARALIALHKALP